MLTALTEHASGHDEQSIPVPPVRHGHVAVSVSSLISMVEPPFHFYFICFDG